MVSCTDWVVKFEIWNQLWSLKEVYLDCSSFMRCQEKLPSCTHTSGSHRILWMDLTQRFCEVIQSNAFLILVMVFSTQVYASKLCQHRGSPLMSCNIPNSHSPWKEMYNFTWDWHQSVVQRNAWELTWASILSWTCLKLLDFFGTFPSINPPKAAVQNARSAGIAAELSSRRFCESWGIEEKDYKKNVHIVVCPMWVVHAIHIHGHHNDHTTIRVWWFTELIEISISPKLTWNIKSVDNASRQIRVSQSSSLSTRVSFDFSVKKTGKSSQVAFAVFGCLPQWLLMRKYKQDKQDMTSLHDGDFIEMCQCKKTKHQSFNR